MNTAELIRFPGPEPGQQERRVADTDDGYTRLANELLEELIGANLTRNQAKVAFAVCRKTYGFNKKTDRIADSQIGQLTRLPRQKVNKAKNELIAMKVLIKDGLAIGPNKNLSEWEIPECHQDGVTVTKMVTKSVTKTVTGLSPKQGHTKDTITKDKKDNITPIVPTGDVSGEIEHSQSDEQSKQTAEQTDPVRAVFSHWQSEHNHPTAKLDDKRRKRIKSRLEQGFTVEELCKAITGAKCDTWLMGKNPSNKVYDGIDTLLRDAAQVEKLRDLADNHHARAIASGQYTATTARNLDNLQRWAGSSDTGAPF
ncbi:MULTISPECIES: replication protein [unclassified Cedecea]|uniref:replication protein n=1 Tax=unclassified Cedecea TaxID=2649846 RepID=UPI0030182975